MEILQAIHHAMNGRAVLFTGAGFSFGATNRNGRKIPAGHALATTLLTEISYANRSGSLDKAAAAYLRRKSGAELVNLLLESFMLGEVTESHREIAKLPWKRTYTTNYDLVFEEARKLEKIACNSVDGIDDPKDHLVKNNLVVHVNGAINRLSENRLGASFKLISESYSADAFEDSGWAFHFRNDIRTASAVIFIGYSMYDLDIRRILFDEDISDKCLFIVAPLNDDNELDAEDLGDLGVVAPIGIDAFADRVRAESESYIPIDDELILDSWSEIKPISGIINKPTDEEVIEFLTEGRLSSSLAMEAIGPNSANYLIDHELTSKIEFNIEKGDKLSLLTGELGTGKTFILDEISLSFLALGWRVFKLNVASNEEIGELQEICKQPDKKLLVIENYQNHLDLLRWLSDSKPENISLAITARTTIHDLFAADLAEIFPHGFEEFDISVLRPNEANNVVKLFDQYGLWGSRQGWSIGKKQSFIKHDCSNSLPSILVDILKSKHITERYRKLLSENHSHGDVEAVLICAFALEVIGFTPRIHHIQELLGNKVRWSNLRAQTELKSIIDINANFLVAKSSVLALHLLHSVFSAKKIVDTLVLMAHAASDRKGSVEYRNILNSLMRYKNVSSILPSENRLPSVINFYENVKNLPATIKNPQFWLQYAIACLALGKLERAERYFDSAYDLVYDGYNTFKLDNSYARLLLEKSMQAASMNDTIFLIDEAKDILLSQMKTEKLYYPYRVALGFFKIYERFSGQWSSSQEDYFKFIFSEIHRNASLSATATGRPHNYVLECLEKSSKILGVVTDR